MATASVLIVDPADESCEVLRAVFEPRGVRVLQATAADEGLQMARHERPDVVVLDLDLELGAEPSLAAAFSSTGAAPALVAVGRARRRVNPPDADFLSKPYHYASLVRKIEALLETAAPAVADAA